MRLLGNLLLVSVVAIIGTGCASVAPPYSASIENVQKLKDNGSYSAKVGDFGSASDPDNVNPLRIRANSASSPYQNSYANYLSEALKQELALSSKLTQNSNIEVSGTLLKNNVHAGGLAIGYADIQARFIVKNRGEVRYDQIKSAHNEWESSFAGAIAIPRATQEYPVLVQKLLGNLYSDQAFLDALK